MGRGRIAAGPLDPEFIREAFVIGSNSGQIIRRSTGEVATFAFKGKWLVRVYFQGKVRRIGALRVAWVLATGEWPVNGRV